MSYADITKQLKDSTAAALARELGAGWSVEPLAPDYLDYPGRRLCHTNGHGLYLDWDRGRVWVGGTWPVTKAGVHLHPSSSENAPKISVATDRTVSALAMEIRRRFLPDYYTLYDTLKERAQGQDTYAAQSEETVRRLVEVGGRRSGQRGSTAVYFQDSHLYQATAQGDSVRFEAFSCPAWLAIKLVELMKERKQQ